MTGPMRDVEAIRADLAAPRPSALLLGPVVSRLLADVDPMLAELEALKRWQAKRVVAVSQDPMCVKWMRQSMECEEQHGDLLDQRDAARAVLAEVERLCDRADATSADELRETGFGSLEVVWTKDIRAALVQGEASA